MRIGTKLCFAAAAVFVGAFATQADENQIHWKSNGAPTETYVTGGGWTLEQSGAAVGLKSAGYCDANGNQVGNPGTERMQPYYFPHIHGQGSHLQGYFDWRPKDTDEAVAAAFSDDAGLTWTFQQKVLELTTQCPTTVQKEPDGEKETIPDPNNSDNSGSVGDDGQGHAFVLNIAGHTYLYTLTRSVGHIDVDDLGIHELFPQPGLPLNGAPLLNDAATDVSPAGTPELPFHTNGLKNPDGILGIVPGTSPLKIIYEQKILNGDTSFPMSQQCNTFWANYYANNPFGTAVNDDITYLRLAETTDGVNFKDDGILQGLNDPTSVSATGTRWLATAGTILLLDNGKYGLLFSGGGCIDGDSDAFHYIGYAESSDLLHWTVVNGLNNPIVSTAPFTIAVDPNGIPASGGANITVPAEKPVTGNTMGWFAGRVYAPSATIFDSQNITVIFAGYHTQKPKFGLGDYRTIGRVSLHTDSTIVAIGQGAEGNGNSQ